MTVSETKTTTGMVHSTENQNKDKNISATVSQVTEAPVAPVRHPQGPNRKKIT